MSRISPLVSAYPSRDRAKIARDFFYQKVINSLIHLKKSAISTLNRADFSLEHLVAIQSVASLNPELFYLHDKLLRAMRASDGLSVNQTLDKLMNLRNGSVENVYPIISSIEDSDCEKFIIDDAVLSLKEDLNRQAELMPITNSEQLHHEKVEIKSALRTIKNLFSDMYDEISQLLAHIRLFSGRVTMGLTDVRMFGCMFIRLPRPGIDRQLYYIEHICHEVSHLYLNAVMSIDPIVLNDREKIYKSPLRSDSRAMIGVFHATFVTSRIVQMFDRLGNSDFTEEIGIYLSQQLIELKNGIVEIGRYAMLTKQGEILLEEIQEIYWNSEKRGYWKNFDFNIKRSHRFLGKGEELTLA
ncbi:aKG-HExxH-type peptide beta-hydroxylase [Advenella mimigardefordensis]|uniref:HEXXH motif domain-containing protein n=1 Tax=Advenella mimigardefordensis (strain DSM 17166 / LMG 22922 / DPN7) TaxID=1247726 RepID=W0PEN4_ADVMD|nr:HEXXH motif-containing putative peptide modification protein [Advenella mimigardefordensis]AHG65424.1 hypothetical protein MIM_c33630 [Advenella mimigardefordensis DPN7]